MPLWNRWRRGGTDPAAEGRAPLPQVGDIVRLHAGSHAEVGVYQARVRAVGPRRILLESAETAAHSDDDTLLLTSALPPRTALTLSFVCNDNLYQCETRVVGPAKAGTLVVARPRIVTKVQRRQFYRLPLQSPTTFRVRGESGSTPPVAARLVNLSGGGALLASGKPVPTGLRVLVRVPAGRQGDLLDVESDALDCRVATQGLARIYLIRLRFLGPPHLTEEDREEIVAYIFEQQRMLLRNRKLLRAGVGSGTQSGLFASNTTRKVLVMSDARRLSLSLLVSLFLNAAVLLAVGWLWRWQPLPADAAAPRIKLVRVALAPKPPAPVPVVVPTRPVPPPPPKPHPIRPKRLPKHRRPGAHVKSSSPAPPAKMAGGSDAGSAAPPVPAAPPIHVIARAQPAPLLVHNVLRPLPPLPTLSFQPGLVAARPVLKAVPAVQTGHGASGADTAGRGNGAGEGAGVGSGVGSGSSRDAGEPFGVGQGLAGDGGPRHVVYVLDISGSMVSRIVRADAELRKAMDTLRPDETFDIIAFNNEVYPFDTELVPATPSMVHQASVFLDTLQVNDGTNTQAGMRAALDLPGVNEVVLLTDGIPTQGITDYDSLADYINHINKNHARISCVGMVGKNPDGTDDSFAATRMLQQIAHDSGGAAKIVTLGVATDD